MKLLRIILLFVCAIIATGTYAQDCDEYTVSAQNGTAYNTPINNYWKYSFTQQIFTHDEVGPAGDITKISFKYSYSSSMTKKNNVKIYLGHTTKNEFSSTTDWVSPTGLTLVYSGNLNCSNGWNEFELDVPFNYNGVDNLLVCVNDESGQYDGSSYTFYYTNCTGNKALVYYDDYDMWTSSDAGSQYSYRSDIRFSFCEPYAMSSGTQTLTTCNVTIYDNGGPSNSYSAYSNDTLIIYPATSGCKVSLTGGTYAIEAPSSSGTLYDYIKIFNGEGVSGTLLSTLSGLNGTITTPITSTASNGALTIVFHSDGSIQQNGFALSFSCDCPITSYNMSSGTHTITACDITVYDNGGPNGDYANNSNDTLIILPSSSGCMVSLTGTYVTESVSFDYIKIYNGTGVSGTLLATLAETGSVTTPISSSASNGALTIVFHSDGSVQKSGYEFFIDCAGGCSCGIGPSGLNTATGDQQVTLSWTAAPGANGYLIEYGPHGFMPGTGTQVSTNGTSYTFNNLVNGTELDFYVSMICNGTPAPPVMVSATPNNKIIMHSGTSTITTCNTLVYDNGGPNGDYSTYSNDTLIIYPSSSGCLVSLTGTYVTESITYDYIKIYNGTGTSGTLLATLAGTGSVTTPIYSSAPNGALTIIFHSDGSSQYSGYEFNIQCNCNVFQVTDTVCFGSHYQNYGFDTTFIIPGEHSLSYVDQDGSIYVLQLYVLPKNHISITGDHYFCADSTIILTASPSVSYLWSTGETTQSISVSQDGTYQVTVTNIYGCTATAIHSVTPINEFISSINIPDMCAGNSYLITGSYETESEIQMYHTQSTLSVADTAFLPDGIPCDPYGCSYRSTLTFTDYSENAIVESVDDIFYVEINMEHSWIGDIYINITCPNGQKADILRWSGSGSTECSSLIPESSRGWQSGSNYGNSAFFGQANDDEDSDNKCDLNASENSPGIGWNYCWSNNTSQGYAYAADGGLVYRNANVHNGIVDSSNVDAGTQFYHPDESFESLIGCPLNGDWYIEVMDGWGVDNGYIFGWELALTDELLISNNFDVSYITPDSIWTTVLSDTSFTISPPADLSGDTTILYTLHFYDSEGCSFDTIVPIQVNAAPHTDIWVTTCDDYEWNGVTYTTSGEYTRTFSSSAGCDSVVTLHLTISDFTTGIDVQTACDEFTWIDGVTYTESNNTATFTIENGSMQGCDSVVTLNLTINDVYEVNDERTICPTALPYIWNDVTFNEAGSQSVTLTAANGCDSIVNMTLAINDAYEVNDERTVCPTALPYQWNGVTFNEAGTQSVTLTAANGCDSVVNMTLSLNDAYEINVEMTVCPTALPYEWNGLTFTEAGSQSVTLTAANGCDSVVNMTLSVNDAYEINVEMTVCPTALPYEWNDVIFNEAGTQSVTLTATNGCDSIVNMTLSINDAYEINVERTICPTALPYEWNDVIFNEAGSQSVTLTAVNGCDSIVNMTLSLNDAYNVNDERTVCPTELPYVWNDVTFTEAGLQSVTLTAANGCDSVVNMTLSLNDAYNVNDERTVCPTALPYIWNGVTFTEAGTQSVTLTAANGCDSIVNMTLSLNDAYNVNDERTICPTALPYEWNGVTFTEAGSQSVTLTAANGCDSIVNMTLALNDAYEINDERTVCPTALPYQWNGVTFNEAGTQSVTLAAANGCDSVVNMTLSLNDAYNVNDERTVCPTALPYSWNGVTFNEAGTQSVTLTADNGCDSVVNMTLSLNDAYNVNDERTVCPTALPYQWNGVTFNEAGTQSVTLTAANGCDSVVNMTLSLNDAYNVNDERTVCPTALPYSWNGVTFNEAGTQSVTLTAANGCDSVVNMTLSLNDAYEINVEMTVCPTALPYEWNGVTFNEAGTQSVTLTAANGCDSIVNMTLALNDAYEVNDERTVCPTVLPYIWNGVTFTEAGSQSVTLTAANGCDSVVNMTLSVFSPTHTATSQEQCGGTFTWNGTEHAESGDYTFSHEDGNGCIQVDTLHLVIHPLPETPILSVTDNTSCTEPNGSISITAPTGDGLTYSLNGGTPQSENSFIGLTTGTFTITVWNNNGCSSSASDSVSTIGSTVNVAASANSPCVNGTLELSASSESSDVSFEWTGPNIFASFEQNPTILNVSASDAGIYTVVVIENATGCTASASTTVIIKQPSTGDTTAVVCESFDWYEHTNITTSCNNLTHTFTNADGCDSVVTLLLTINNVAYGTDTQIACDSFTWIDGNTYTSSNNTATHIIVGGSAQGCDSIVTLNLTINDSYEVNEEHTICPNALPFEWNGVTFNAAGTQSVTLTATNGCDSVVNMTLYVNNDYEVNEELTVCPNALPYEWNGVSFSIAGTQSVTLTAANGCDSVVNMTLSLNDAYEINDERTVCPTALPYIWNDVTFNEAGTQSVTLTAANGCDSVVNMTLSLNDAYTVNDERTVCPTALPYEWNGVTFTEAGFQSVTLTAANGCDSVVTLHLTINTPTHTSTSQEQCGGTFTWNGTEYAESGDYTFSHEDDNGCIQVDTLHLIIHPLPETPVLIATDNTSCADPNGAVTIDSPVGTGFSYSINGTDFQTQTTFNGLNTGDFTVTVMDEYGCTSTAPVNVGTVGNTVTAVASANTPCAGGILELYAETGTTGATFAWTGPNDYNSNEQNPTLEYASSNLNGEYTLTVTDPVTHCSMSANVYVNVITPNAGNISINGVTTLCYGENTTLTAFVSGNNGDISYTWSNGETGATVTVAPMESTTYTVTATATIDECTASADTSVDVTINALPQVNISGEFSFCQGESTTLIATEGYTYLWNNNLPSQSISVSEGGTYTVTVTDGNNCSNSTSVSVNMLDLPAIPILNPTDNTSCTDPNGAITVDSPVGPDFTYSINGTDFQTETFFNDLHPGDYIITVMDENGCINTASVNVGAVGNTVDAVASANTPCAGEPLILTAETGTSEATFEWIGPNGYNSSEQNPTRDNANDDMSGQYTLTVTNPVTHCSAASNVIVTVNSPNTGMVNIYGVTTLCFGDSTELIVTPTGGNGEFSYVWNTGDTTTHISLNPVESTTYTVSTTAVIGDCSASTETSVYVTVNALPDASISGITAFCEDDVGKLTATEGVSFLWSNNATTQSIYVFESGTYAVTVTDINNCSNSDSVSVELLPLPSIPILTPTDNSSCTVPNGAITVESPIGAGFTYSIDDINYQPETVFNELDAGYYVVIVFNEYGCASAAPVSVGQIGNMVDATASANTPCAGESLELTAETNIEGATFFWTGPNEYNSNEQNPTRENANDETNGQYILTVTDPETHCSMSDTVFVSVISPNTGTVTITGDTVFCEGDSAELSITVSDNNGNLSYLWNTGESTTTISVNPSQSSIYTVTTIATLDGCSTSTETSVNVIVNTLPDVNISGTLIFCDGEVQELTATDGYNYLWDNNSTSQSILVSEGGEYAVTATDSNGCTNYASVNVTVNPIIHVTIDTTICHEASYPFDNQLITASGTYIDTLTSSYSCDSIVTLNLTVADELRDSLFVDICLGDSYFHPYFGELSPTETHTYQTVVTLDQGCSQTFSLTLTVHQPKETHIDTSLCVGDLYQDNGFNIIATHTTDTTYILNDTTTFGCDSTIFLHMIVHPSTDSTIHVTIVQNDLPFELNNTYYYATGIYTQDTLNTFGCDSIITLNLIVNENVSNEIDSTICDDALPMTWNSVEFLTAGDTTITLSAATGADSVLAMHLHVNPTYHIDILDTVCAGLYFESHGFQITAFSDTVLSHNDQSIAGCDSVTTLHLTVKQPTAFTDVHDTCDSFTWIDGVTYTESTIEPTVTLVNAAGCDSVITLHLTIRKSTDYTDVHDTCDSFTWIDGITYTESTNSPIVTLVNAAGCDSIVTLDLTIRNTTTYTDTYDTCCNSFTWIDGITYTESTNSPTFTLTNTMGCDSIVSLHLTIRKPTTYTDIHDTCDSFTWINGITYTESTNTPTVTLTNAAGCDSIVTLNLTIYHPTHTAMTETACESFFWNGQTYTQSGTYTFAHPDANSCTQVDTLHLIVNYPVHTSVTETACESYLWNGQTYISSGTYTYSHEDANGCTQVDTLHLTINYPTHTALSDTACESYTWNSQTYTQSGTYTFSHDDANGCTQVDTLHLIVHHPIHIVTTESACESLEWNDNTYTESGTYLFTHLDTHGCTQVDTLHLTIHFPTHTAVSQFACNDYVWNSKTYSSSGTYTFSHPDENGCEQVDTLHLTFVDPTTTITPLTNHFCSEGRIVLEVQTNLEDYVWSTGETSQTIIVNEEGTYTVTASQGDCEAEASFTIEPCEWEILLPNAINPDGDGLNDFFSIPEAYYDQINDFHFSIYIYNRWGTQVFSSTSKYFQWNGEVNGTVYHDNVYNYIIEYRTKSGSPRKLKGSITVL